MLTNIGQSPNARNQRHGVCNSLFVELNTSKHTNLLQIAREETSIQENQDQDYNSIEEPTKTRDTRTTIFLSCADDKYTISKFQCFLRQQIEFFAATPEDVNTHSRGRNKKVEVGQVGIRCVHCSKQSVKERSKGTAYFPSTLEGIYQAAQNMNKYHFYSGCPTISETCKSQFNDTLSSRSCGGGGKAYWSMSAEQKGLIETVAGLRFKYNCTNQKTEIDEASLRQLELATKEATSVIDPQDKDLTTDYTFMLFAQIVPYDSAKMGPMNRLPALVCKHCKGCDETGRFFRKKVSSLIKNESLAKMDNHIRKCQFCPDEIKAALKTFKQTHNYQLRRLKRGGKKALFTKMMRSIDAQSMNVSRESM